MPCVLLPVVCCDAVVAGGAAECIVVSVVVRDRTDGAGDEKVLSPWPEPTPPPTVADVSTADGASSEGGVSECGPSVDIVGAADLFPMVGGCCPSSDMLAEGLLPRSDSVLIELPVGTVEKERRLPAVAAESPLM